MAAFSSDPALEAGAPEIEITERMIAAGVDVLSSEFLALVAGLDEYPEIVRTVFSRMEAARLERPE